VGIWGTYPTIAGREESTREGIETNRTTTSYRRERKEVAK
jgi:hypothetical protein